MSITVTLRGGSGDMLKSTYDPNLDGVIAIAETESDMKKSDYDPDDFGKIPIKRIEGGSKTGAVIDYEDCTDKQIDYEAAEETGFTAYADCGTPYTVALADMDDKSGSIKVALSGDIKTSAAAHTAYLAYNIDGGGDVEIGTHTGDTVYTTVTKTDVVVVVGQVIQFRVKNVSAQSSCEKREVKQTHGGRKTLTGYYE